MSLFIRTLYEHSRRRAETALLLRCLQPYINQHECNFNLSEEMQGILWSYYRLQKNYRKSGFWKQDRMNVSENEQCFYKLIQLYIRLQKQIDFPLTKKERNMMREILQRHQERPICITKANFAERRIYK